MKRILITLAVALGATTAAHAASGAWSLDSCISHAVSHNISVRQRQLQVRGGELDITENRDRVLPQLSGYAAQSWSFGRGLTAENTYTNRNTSNFNVGASLQLPLFQGLQVVRRDSYAKANLRTMVEQLEAAKDDVTLNVISQYLQVLYAGEVADLAREQLRLSTVETERRRALLDAGKIAELELTQALSQQAQDEVSVTNALNDRRVALLDLARLLDIDFTPGFDIMPLDNGTDAIILPAESVIDHAMANNHSLRAGRSQIDAAARQVSLARTGYIPTLSFSAGIGSNYYTVGGYPSEGFGPQMRHNFSQSLGFSLSVPLFDAFSTRNSVRRARLQQLQAELDYEDATRTVRRNIEQAWVQARGAAEKVRAATAARTATEAAFLAMQDKYNLGAANATEFEQAKSEYIRASAELIQARYESLLRARILEFYNGSM